MPEPERTADGTRKSPARPAAETAGSGRTGAWASETASKLPAARSHIGRFQVRKLLGEGAFAFVYLAFDPELEREVAIKVPKAEGLTPEAQEVFIRENRLAAIIQHPNICPVYEVGTDGGVPYIVMRVVPNTLAGLLKRLAAPMPARNAVAITRKLALGLVAAHAQKVIHRDLKPANVLYDEANREVLIADFGLARFTDAGTAASNGVPKGTPAYMAPEQARGRVNEIGPASDVYALGVILYELLTGRVPFTGSVWEVMRDHCETPPVPPSVVRLGLDPRADALCLKAMAKAPADRYPSARDFGQALAEYLRAADQVGVELVPPLELDGPPLPPAPTASLPKPLVATPVVVIPYTGGTVPPPRPPQLAGSSSATLPHVGRADTLPPPPPAPTPRPAPAPERPARKGPPKTRSKKRRPAYLLWGIIAAVLVCCAVVAGVLSNRKPAEPKPTAANPDPRTEKPKDNPRPVVPKVKEQESVPVPVAPKPKEPESVPVPVAPVPVAPVPSEPKPLPASDPREADRAIAAGLAWLAREQKFDGHWEFDGTFKAEKTAATGLALLAFLGAGETHKPAPDAGDPKYQKNIIAALNYLKANCSLAGASAGRFGTAPNSTMYAQGITTLALCEAYGMTKDPQLKVYAQAAVNYIQKAQATNGSWGYAPSAPTGDTSITGWQVRALRSAVMAKLIVDDRVLKKAVAFLDLAAGAKKAAYGYTDRAGAQPGTALTAVGLLCRYYIDGWTPNHLGLTEGVAGLMKNPPPGTGGLKNFYYFYYASQVVHFAGGTDWATWNDGPKQSDGTRRGGLRDWLVGAQVRAAGADLGSWEPESGWFGASGTGVGATGCGRVGTTTIALLMLEIPSQRLPQYVPLYKTE